MRLFATLGVLVCAALMGGCANAGFYQHSMPLAGQADQFNQAAADAERLMIVRNVMRARDRNSMVFTRINTMRGSMSRSVSNQFGLSVDENANNDGLTAGASLSGQNSPSFDVTVINDEKFNRAIQTSLDLGIYQLLVEYGWPRNLIHTLFIERVDEGDEIYYNDPDNWARFENFRTWLDGHSLMVCGRSNPTTVGPVLQLSGSTDLEDIAAIAAAKLTLRQESRGWRVVRPNVDRYFAAHCPGPGESADENSYGVASQTVSGSEGHAQNGAAGSVETLSPPNSHAGAAPPAPTRVIHVRSLQGMLYYLVEVVRAEHEGRGVVDVRGSDTSDTRRPLFVVQPGTCEGGLNFVHDDNVRYTVPPRVLSRPENEQLRAYVPPIEAPRCHGQPTRSGPGAEIEPLYSGQTQQVISLIVQLIGITQAREDPPGTAAVQIVN